jgi:hypothetical protein
VLLTTAEGVARSTTHLPRRLNYLAEHPEASLSNQGMAGNSAAHANLVAASYDFSRMGLAVDVAGGRGRLLATILERNPH